MLAKKEMTGHLERLLLTICETWYQRLITEFALLLKDASSWSLHCYILPAPAVIDGDVGGSWHHKSWRFYSHEVWHGAIYYNHWHGRIYYQPLLIRVEQIWPLIGRADEMQSSHWLTLRWDPSSFSGGSMKATHYFYYQSWYSIHFSSGYKLRAISDVKCGFVLIMSITFQRLTL